MINRLVKLKEASKSPSHVLRCAVIGCGRIGCGFDDNKSKITRTHAGAYSKNNTTELVALCDIDKDKLQKYGKKFKVVGLYANSSEMFKREHLDCVSICTLPNSHLDLVKEAANYGIKGIFLEKPMSNSLSNAKKIIEICKKNKITLIIDHQRRFDPFYHSIKKIINQNKLGKIQLVNLYYGAGIANTCSHIFDVLRMFFGEVEIVSANFSENESGNKLDPNLDVVLRFKNGIIVRLNAVDVRNYGILEMDILGTTGRLKLNLATNALEYFKISQEDFLVYKNLVMSNINVKRSNQPAIILGVRNLVKCVQTKNEPLCSGEDGYRSMELIIASLQSSTESKEVSLNSFHNDYKINSK